MPAKSFYLRSCHGKAAYSTPEKAMREIARSHPQVNMKSYLCPFCRMWHIGHAGGAVRVGRVRVGAS